MTSGFPDLVLPELNSSHYPHRDRPGKLPEPSLDEKLARTVNHFVLGVF